MSWSSSLSYHHVLPHLETGLHLRSLHVKISEMENVLLKMLALKSVILLNQLVFECQIHA